MPMIPTRAAARKGVAGFIALAATMPVAASNVTRHPVAAIAPAPRVVENPVDARRRADFAAMQDFRPGYAFWQHVFTLPDGSIAFGSATDGHLLSTFPAKGDWAHHAVWSDPALAHVLEGQTLARKLSERRDQVAALLESVAGPVVDN